MTWKIYSLCAESAMNFFMEEADARLNCQKDSQRGGSVDKVEVVKELLSKDFMSVQERRYILKVVEELAAMPEPEPVVKDLDGDAVIDYLIDRILDRYAYLFAPADEYQDIPPG